MPAAIVYIVSFDFPIYDFFDSRGESKLSYSIDKRAAETVIYCYLQTTSRQLPDFQAAPKPAYLPLSTEVPYQNSGTP